MANNKRSRSGYRKELGRYRLNRAAFLVIEKILREYADTCEMKYAGVSKVADGRRHMPRKVVDRYVSIGRYRPFYITIGWGECGFHFAGVDWVYYEDSIKFVSSRRYRKRLNYVELAAWPGLKITFTPLSTVIYAQTHYATGNELKVMKSVAYNIERYILNLPCKLVNCISLN